MTGQLFEVIIEFVHSVTVPICEIQTKQYFSFEQPPVIPKQGGAYSTD